MKTYVVTCDRCKKVTNNKYKEFEYVTTKHENNFTSLYVKHELDLCEECYTDIINCIYKKIKKEDS